MRYEIWTTINFKNQVEIFTLDQKNDRADSAKECISELKDQIEEVSQKTTEKKKEKPKK